MKLVNVKGLWSSTMKKIKAIKVKKGFWKILLIVVGTLITAIYVLVQFFWPDHGESYIKHSPQKIARSEDSGQVVQTGEVKATKAQTKDAFQEEVLPSEPINETKVVRQHPNGGYQPVKYNYRAKQVIGRDDKTERGQKLDSNSNMVGELLVSIDTREQDGRVRVILPYGSGTKGSQLIPKGAVLIGKTRYGSGSDRVMIDFDKCLTPDGNSYQIEAQALDSSDYRSGIKGDYHSNATSRVVKTVGLGLVSGMGEVFTSKMALGEGGAVVPKATLENALSQGVVKASNTELEKQLKSGGSGDIEYLTVDSGKELIISLTAPFMARPLSHEEQRE